MLERAHWNGARWRPQEARGHYESWFLRANHPSRPLAFWIRYTIFEPRGRPGDARGELWAVAFDAERGRVVGSKQDVDIGRCAFGKSALEVTIGDATLDAEALVGGCEGQGHRFAWSMRYASDEPPLLLVDPPLYGAPLPKAKALVPAPLAVFDGWLEVDGERIPIDGWVGSQNHNWGSQHTDRYAWGQVAGFDGRPDAFLEVACAQVRLGPVYAPRLTPLVLRLDGEELAFRALSIAARARGRYDLFHFAFETRGPAGEVSGVIAAPREAFVALPYDNPPGGTKTCLNAKIASCHLTVRRPGRPPLALRSAHRAAFEILTDADDHGVPRIDRG